MRYFFIERPKTTIFLFTILTLALALPITQMKLESDITAYLPQDTGVIQTLIDVSQDWATEFYIVIVHSDNVLDGSVLDEITRIEGLINPDRDDGGTRDGVSYTLSIASLLSSTPLTADPETILSIAPSELTGMMISADRRQTAVLVGVYPMANRTDLNRRITAAVETSDLDVSATGLPLISEEMVSWAMENIYIVFIAIFLLFLVLYFYHRTLKSVVICLLPPLFAMIQTYGILVLSGFTLTTEVVVIVAPMILALGVNYGVYLMERYASTEGSSPQERLHITMGTTGKAILLSAITTVIGFVSLIGGILPSLRIMGIALAIGIALTFIATSLLVPSLILILRYKKKNGIGAWKRISKVPARYGKIIVVAVIALCCVSLFTMGSISTNVDYFGMAPEDIGSLKTMLDYSQSMGASAQPNIVLVDGNVTDVRALNGLQRLAEGLNAIENVSVVGISTIYESLWSSVPLLPELYGDFPQEQWQINILNHLINSFMEGETLGTFMSGDRTILLINTPMMDIEESTMTVGAINEILQGAQIPGCTLSKLTGSLAITVEINSLLMESQRRTLVICLVAVFLVTVAIFRSLKLGMLAVIPAIFVIAYEPLMLFLLNIPLSMVTISLASMLIGLGVDYGIEIVQRFKDEGGGREGMSRSVEQTGLALTEAVTTEIIGIAPALLINIGPIRQFIMLLILMILLAYAFAVFFLPSLYFTFSR